MFGDFDGDGQPDLFVPQNGRLQAVPQRRQGPVHRRDGEGRRPGEVTGWATPCAAWGDSTTTASSIWSSAACAARTASSATRATARSRTHGGHRPDPEHLQHAGGCLVDLNGDGMLDWCSTTRARNRRAAGQPGPGGKKTPVTVQLRQGGDSAARSASSTADGQVIGTHAVSGGDGRGGQRGGARGSLCHQARTASRCKIRPVESRTRRSPLTEQPLKLSLE